MANIVSQTKVQVGNFNFAATAYTDLLDNAGGAQYSRSITKGASSDVLVLANVYGRFTTNSNVRVQLGVHDGATDHDLGSTRWNGTSHGNAVAPNRGLHVVTGLGAGSHTFKLRGKSPNIAHGMQLTSGMRNHITLIEVGTGAINYAIDRSLYPTTFSTVGTSVWVDVLDASAGAKITATINKVSATSNILAIVTGSAQSGGGSLLMGFMGVRYSGTDYFMASSAHRSGQGNATLDGERLFTGLGTGNHTFDLRARVTGSALSFTANVNFAGLLLLEI